jgi:hypothetical protein
MEANTELIQEVEDFLEHLEDALGNNPDLKVSGHKVMDLVNRLSAEYYRAVNAKPQIQHITSFDMRL